MIQIILYNIITALILKLLNYKVIYNDNIQNEIIIKNKPSCP